MYHLQIEFGSAAPIALFFEEFYSPFGFFE